MIPKWFLVMFLSTALPGQTDPWSSAIVMRKSFDSLQSCITEATTNRIVSFSTAGNLDQNAVPGVICVRGFIKTRSAIK